MLGADCHVLLRRFLRGGRVLRAREGGRRRRFGCSKGGHKGKDYARGQWTFPFHCLFLGFLKNGAGQLPLDRTMVNSQQADEPRQ